MNAKENPNSIFHYPSVPLRRRNELPEIQGLYFVMAGYRLLYIGRSTNIRKRWIDHHRTRQLEAIDCKSCVSIAWMVMELENEEGLAFLEDYYIDKFRPCLNRTSVSLEMRPDPERISLEVSLRKDSDAFIDIHRLANCLDCTTEEAAKYILVCWSSSMPLPKVTNVSS